MAHLCGPLPLSSNPQTAQNVVEEGSLSSKFVQFLFANNFRIWAFAPAIIPFSFTGNTPDTAPSKFGQSWRGVPGFRFGVHIHLPEFLSPGSFGGRWWHFCAKLRWRICDFWFSPLIPFKNTLLLFYQSHQFSSFTLYLSEFIEYPNSPCRYLFKIDFSDYLNVLLWL